MMIRRSLTALTAAALLLTACAGDDATDTGDTTTEQPADDGDDATDGDSTDEGATDDDAAGADSGDSTDGGAAGGDSQLLTVGLSFDGQRVPIADACSGVDGAVLATTEGEVTITLVREEGTALRYDGEGLTAETDEVEVEEIGESTIYRATLESDQVPAVDVELELGDTSVLEDC